MAKPFRHCIVSAWHAVPLPITWPHGMPRFPAKPVLNFDSPGLSYMSVPVAKGMESPNASLSLTTWSGNRRETI